MSVVMPLMEEYRLRMFANMVLMKIFRPKRDEVEIAYSGASTYEQLTNIHQVIISRRVRCTGLVAHTGERRCEVH
jgi:hypothetical protein